MKMYTREEFESRYDRLWIEVESFTEMSSSPLIHTLETLQAKHGKLSISVGDYSEVIISRLQTKQEYAEYIDRMYENYVKQFELERQKEFNAQEVERLIGEKRKIDQQISSLLKDKMPNTSLVLDYLDCNWKEEWGFVNGR